jgi:20S proteasome alpha/beta subunit
VVTVYVFEGIVLAADSRLTLEFQVAQGAVTKHHSVPSSDSTYKLFQAPNNVGVSAFGAAAVGTTPVAAVVEAFFAKELASGDKESDTVAAMLLEHFRSQPGPPATRFHVAGYKDGAQRVLEVDVAGNAVKQLNNSGPGVAWGGEADPLSRLLQKVGSLDQNGQLVKELPLFGTAFQHFTLQDAVDFAVYAIRTTADTMRFQMRAQTVGGPIDVLVIRPSGASWLRRKELRLPGTA